MLDLARNPGYDAEDFLVSGSNADTVALLDLWPDWPAPTLILVGPPGSGKTHLATMWARRANAVTLRTGDPIDLARLGEGRAVLMEDCDRALGSEAALFHLLNAVKETKGWLTVTARSKPDAWGIATPDLLSRLRQAPSVELGRPDQALMRAVLVKMFTERQIRIEEEIISFAALHLEQSLEAAVRFVQAADEASLAANRRISRPLAAATIAALQGDD